MGTVCIAFATLALSIVVQCHYPIENPANVRDYSSSRMGQQKSISTPISYHYTPRYNRAHEWMRRPTPSHRNVIRRKKMNLNRILYLRRIFEEML